MSKKRHVFFILPFLVFILCQSGCKKNSLFDNEILYDIRGEWTIINYYSGGFTGTVKCTFSGNFDSGTVTSEFGESGTYSVGKAHGYPVEFYFLGGEGDWTYYESHVGEFIDANYMKGWSSDFEWRATREVGTK